MRKPFQSGLKLGVDWNAFTLPTYVGMGAAFQSGLKLGVDWNQVVGSGTTTPATVSVGSEARSGLEQRLHP